MTFCKALIAFALLIDHVESRPRLRRVVVSAGRDQSWLWALGADEVVICSTRSTVCPKLDHKAQDGQALLSFLVNNYHRLSRLRIAFVHGGRREWHNPGNVDQVIRTSWNLSGFVHLSNPSRRCTNVKATGWCTNIFAPQNITCPARVCTYPGLQFVADGVGFLRHSLRQWDGLLTTCNGLDDPPREFGRGYRGCGFAMEYMGQVLAGGPLDISEQLSPIRKGSQGRARAHAAGGAEVQKHATHPKRRFFY